jgi:hypothetical protein
MRGAPAFGPRRWSSATAISSLELLKLEDALGLPDGWI